MSELDRRSIGLKRGNGETNFEERCPNKDYLPRWMTYMDNLFEIKEKRNFLKINKDQLCRKLLSEMFKGGLCDAKLCT